MTAQDIAFDERRSTAPAGKPFTIAFDNQDDGHAARHRRSTTPAGKTVFEGERSPGPRSSSTTSRAHGRHLHVRLLGPPAHDGDAHRQVGSPARTHRSPRSPARRRVLVAPGRRRRGRLRLERRRRADRRSAGDPAPTITGTDARRHGRSTSPRSAGQPVVVNFWASWCVPVPRGVPAVQGRARGARRADGLAIVGVLYKRPRRSPARQFVDELRRDVADGRSTPTARSRQAYRVVAPAADATSSTRRGPPVDPDRRGAGRRLRAPVRADRGP